jgi:hypothetical protein
LTSRTHFSSKIRPALSEEEERIKKKNENAADDDAEDK